MSNDDPADWTVCATGTTTSFHAVAWGGGKFLAVGADGPSRASSDGMNWSGPAEWSGVPFSDVVWGGMEFVTAGDGATIGTTRDGVDWRYRQVTTTAELNSVAWNGTVLVIVGGAPYGSPDVSVIATGPDADTLTVQEVPTHGALWRVRWLDGQFVAVGVGTLLTSPDGLTWTDVSAVGGIGACAGATLMGVAWSGARFVVGGVPTYTLGWSNPVAGVSLDGVGWSCNFAGSWYGGLWDVLWDGRRFLAVGDPDGIVASADGVNWTVLETPVGLYLFGLGSNGHRVVAVGDEGTILTSEYVGPRARRHVSRGVH